MGRSGWDTVSRPRAKIRVLDLPHLGPGARRWEVDCPANTTGLSLLSGPDLDVTDGVIAIVAAAAHEDMCGQCELGDVQDQGDPALRERADLLWDALFAAAMMERKD